MITGVSPQQAQNLSSQLQPYVNNPATGATTGTSSTTPASGAQANQPAATFSNAPANPHSNLINPDSNSAAARLGTLTGPVASGTSAAAAAPAAKTPPVDPLVAFTTGFQTLEDAHTKLMSQLDTSYQSAIKTVHDAYDTATKKLDDQFNAAKQNVSDQKNQMEQQINGYPKAKQDAARKSLDAQMTKISNGMQAQYNAQKTLMDTSLVKYLQKVEMNNLKYREQVTVPYLAQMGLLTGDKSTYIAIASPPNHAAAAAAVKNMNSAIPPQLNASSIPTTKTAA